MIRKVLLFLRREIVRECLPIQLTIGNGMVIVHVEHTSAGKCVQTIALTISRRHQKTIIMWCISDIFPLRHCATHANCAFVSSNLQFHDRFNAFSIDWWVAQDLPKTNSCTFTRAYLFSQLKLRSNGLAWEIVICNRSFHPSNTWTRIIVASHSFLFDSLLSETLFKL